jgi:hypothetical protein
MNQPRLQKIENANEKILGLVMFVGPLMTLPQIYSIWFESSEGVSILTWLTYFLTQVFWFIHALKINDKLDIISGLLWLIVDLMIIVGLVLKMLVR